MAYNGLSLLAKEEPRNLNDVYGTKSLCHLHFERETERVTVTESHYLFIYSFKFHTSIINNFNTDINTKIAGFIVKGSQAIKLKPPPSTSSIHAFHTHFQPFDFDHPIWYFLFPRLVFFFFLRNLFLNA